MTDLVTRTLSAEGISPLLAYAKLRAQTPGRSSYLIEAGAGGVGRGRYSILGYRTRAESLYPGGGNVFSMIIEELTSAGPEKTFAELVSQAHVGYIGYDAVHALQEIEPWPDETDLARMTRDSTAVVFDGQEKTMTIAGRSKGAVDRCEWEMTHGPEIPELPALDPNAEAAHVDAQMDDAMFNQRAGKARARIAEGVAERVVMARLFKAPLRGSDPFDVYRALASLSPAPYHFFFEFAEMPMAEGVVVIGSSAEGAISGSMQATADPVKALSEMVPGSALMGSPKERVAAIIREIEPSSRGLFGGSVGFLGPTGVIELAVATTAIVLRKGFYETRGGVTITAESDPKGYVAAVRAYAQPALAAIRAAQDIAKALQ